MEEAFVDGREFRYERDSNVWFSRIRFERGEGESEKVSGRGSKNFRVSF